MRDLDRLKRVVSHLNEANINEANVKVTFNLNDLENAVLKFENGTLSAEDLAGFLKREIDKSLQKKQVRDEKKARKEQEIEEIKKHARMLFAEAFEASDYDTKEQAIVDMVEYLAHEYVQQKTKHPNLRDDDLAVGSLVSVWHYVTKEWREILEKIKNYFKGKIDVQPNPEA